MLHGFNNDIDIAITRDNALFIWKHSKNSNDRLEFRRLRNLVTKLIRNAKTVYFNNNVMPNTKKHSDFWNRVKKLGLPNEDNRNNFKVDPNVFCNFIESSNNPHNSTPIIKPVKLNNNIFSFQNVDVEIVTCALFSLKSDSVGLDCIPLKFIK